MSLDVSGHVVCSRCGDTYSKYKGYFHTSYSPTNKGIGYMTVCKDCVKTMYQQYVEECGDEAHAMRQVCRKLDLYWSDKLFASAMSRSGVANLATRYCSMLTTNTYAGKCYDDTLVEEGQLWSFVYAQNDNEPKAEEAQEVDIPEEDDSPVTLDEDNIEITDDIVRFWGSGYPKSMYRSLEQRRRYWMSRLPDGLEMDIGTEALIRQICSLELDINRDRMDGKSIEKSVNALNNLLGSANLKPTQKKDDNDSSLEKTPMGVWIWKYENEKPIPDVDPELEDVDGIKKYILTWFYGHIGKMMGVKNAHSKLYDKAIEDLRVEHPEFDDEDDDDMLFDVLDDHEE